MTRHRAGAAVVWSVAPWVAASAVAQVGDPTTPGPLPVSSIEYNDPLVTIPDVPYPVDVWAVTWYPTDLSAGPYPLVLLLHGNYAVCSLDGALSCSADPPACPPGATSVPSHRGYDYIAERLASWGYVVASINANAINCRFDGVPERGRLVQEHLRRWAAWNAPTGAAPFGTLFAGKVDLDHVGLVGHSRGGEGMRAAYEFNRTQGVPHGIKALFEIAPVDDGIYNFDSRPLFNADSVSYSVLLPYCDNDVTDLAGMRVYDRAQRIIETNPTPKAQQMVWGANHSFFNSEWEDEAASCIDQVRLTRAEQEQVGRTYVMGFVRTVLGGEDFRDLFTGDQPPPALPAHVDTAYTESRSAIMFLTDFGDQLNATFGSGIPGVLITPCKNQGGPGFCGVTWKHDVSQHAARLEWFQLGGRLRIGFPDDPETGPQRNVRDRAFLTFRIAEPNDPNDPALPGGLDFAIQLADAHGSTSATVRAADHAYIHAPIGPDARLSVLETVRIPLAEFTGIDLGVLRTITIAFDQTPGGSVFLSDVAFSSPPAVCGDGVLTAPEACDDGNTAGGDCCSATCSFEPAGATCPGDNNICTADRCDGAGVCTHDYVPAPACVVPSIPGGAVLSVDADTEPRSDLITFKWKKGPAVPVGDFGNPSTGSPLYEWCVYDAVPGRIYRGQPLGPCGSEPCWKQTRSGWNFKSPTGAPDGVAQIKLKGSLLPGKASVQAKAKGSFLGAGVDLSPPVIVQVRTSDGHCWGASFSTPRKDVPGQFKAKSD